MSSTVRPSSRATSFLRGLALFSLSVPFAAPFNATVSLADGIYVSGKIGRTTTDHEIARGATTPGLPVADSSGVFSTDDGSFSGGVAIGAKTSLGGGPLFVGGEIFATLENTSSRNIAGVLVTDVDVNNTYGARALAGVKASDRLGLYVHGGYTNVNFDVRNSYTFAPPVKSDTLDEGGFSYGVGAGVAIADRTTAFVEYSQIDDLNFSGLAEVAGGTNRVNPNSLDLSNISVGLKYNF